MREEGRTRSQFRTQSLSKALITGQAVGFPPSAGWRKSLSSLCDETADGSSAAAPTELFSITQAILQTCQSAFVKQRRRRSRTCALIIMPNRHALRHIGMFLPLLASEWP